MIKIKMDAENVYKNLKEAVELSKDPRPVLLKIRGDYGDRKAWTMIGATHRGFVQQSTPDGTKWKDLNDTYAKKKMKTSGFSGGPTSILIRSGALFNALVFGSNNGVNVLTRTSITYGISDDALPYAKFHMTGTSKMPARRFLGATQYQLDTWFSLIRSFVNDVISGRANREGK